MRNNLFLSCVAAIALSLVLYAYGTGSKLTMETPAEAARNLVRLSEVKIPKFDLATAMAEVDSRVYIGRNNVWAVLMLTSDGTESTTLVALADGNVTFTREVDGKQTDALVGVFGDTAVRMNQIADSLYGLCESASRKNKPVPGETLFCIMSRQGLAIYRDNTDDLEHIHSEFAPLYHAGRGLLMDLAKANPAAFGPDFEQMTAAVQ